jgi:hypothetical protein
MHGSLRALSSVLLRLVVVATPPLLVVSALSAAPKTAPKPAPKPAKPPAPKPAPKAPPKPGKPADAGADAAETGALAPKEKEPVAAKDAGAEPGELVKETEKKEGDASVKVFEFGTTEISGRARWPAVTYFVRRMRAEFEAQKLPHRPFLPELSGTKADPAVK